MHYSFQPTVCAQKYLPYSANSKLAQTAHCRSRSVQAAQSLDSSHNPVNMVTTINVGEEIQVLAQINGRYAQNSLLLCVSREFNLGGILTLEDMSKYTRYSYPILVTQTIEITSLWVNIFREMYNLRYLYQQLDGNTDRTSGVYHALPQVWLTSLEVRTKQYSNFPDWRWELYGCARLADGENLYAFNYYRLPWLPDDVVTPLVVMRSMRSALWDVPPLMNALDLDKETAEATLLLSDDDNSTCLDPPDSCDAWHALIRIPLFPGITPLRIVGHGIQCDFRHVLVTHQQTVTSSRLASRVCRLVSNADCEAHCTDDDQDLRDVAVYVRAGAGAALCQITADSLSI
ncbi:hypothetical protein CAPTEDRAFT_187668 [Capitella teleta]|uniref:Uncharacterized protein n=1 Tax=Capitella teleta TaxID=283909 RepID=R7U4P0_CAPTE|nr:hypothetical protein CAPTEDRAFT_187668 [Capitella teleta]|eukprot:ELU01330.1 hypothetical protein CAPTEDRAFT_187668 [Capitella teleta]